MNDIMATVRDLSVEDLEQLARQVAALAAEERRQASEEVEFSFEVTTDPRKQGGPYVAKLVLGADGKVEREFYPLDRTWGRKQVTVSGTFRAREGEVIEQREGGSWNNEYRYWYIVHDRELRQVASIQDSVACARVKRYLRGELAAEELLAPGVSAR